MHPWIPASQKLKIIAEPVDTLEEDAAEIFFSIPFHHYSYIDTAVKGGGMLYGLVAESLQEVLPDCVLKEVDYVPNIYEYATVYEKKLAPGSKFEYQLDFNKFMRDRLETLKSTTIQLHKDKKHPFEATVKGIKDEMMLIHTVAELKEGEKIFVYGSKEEILSVNKEQIFELGLVAIKDLQLRVDALEEELSNKKATSTPVTSIIEPLPTPAPETTTVTSEQIDGK